jgi:hypothetical protein
MCRGTNTRGYLSHELMCKIFVLFDWGWRDNRRVSLSVNGTTFLNLCETLLAFPRSITTVAFIKCYGLAWHIKITLLCSERGSGAENSKERRERDVARLFSIK